MAIDKDALRSTVGANVRRLRKLAGMTQVQLAERCECSQAFITQLERGECSASDVMLFTLADAFGVPTDALRQETTKSRASA